MDISILTDELSLDLDTALFEGKRLGFKKYELRCIDSYEQRIPNIPAKSLETLYAAVDAKEIEITALTPGLFKVDFSDRTRIRFQIEGALVKTCQIAVRLGASKVIVFGFLRGAGGDEAEVIALLREACAIADEYGLQLLVENEPGCFCDTGVNTTTIVKAVDRQNAGVNWDPANAIVSGEAAYPVGYNAVLPYLRNVHIKDSIPLADGKWKNFLIGDGGVNWIGQLRALLRDMPVEYLTLETHVVPELKSTVEDLRRLRILLKAARDFEK